MGFRLGREVGEAVVRVLLVEVEVVAVAVAVVVVIVVWSDGLIRRMSRQPPKRRVCAGVMVELGVMARIPGSRFLQSLWEAQMILVMRRPRGRNRRVGLAWVIVMRRQSWRS